MNIKLFSAAIFASILLTACGGDGDGNVVIEGPIDEEVIDEGGLVTVLPEGESTLTTIEQIESVLANNSEIKAGQTVIFVLPQEQQTLVLDSDLTIKGDLTIK